MMSPVNKRNSSMSPRDRDMNSHSNQPTTSTNNNYQQSQIELISFINNEFNKVILLQYKICVILSNITHSLLDFFGKSRIFQV